MPLKTHRNYKDEVRKTGNLRRVGSKMRCGVCKKYDHNSRSCPTKPNDNHVRVMLYFDRCICCVISHLDNYFFSFFFFVFFAAPLTNKKEEED